MTGTGLSGAPVPSPLTNLAPSYLRGCVCTVGHWGCSHWVEREELRTCSTQADSPSPAPALPAPLLRSPALAVLCCGDTGAHIVVVPILVVAATLGHTLHLVLAEERLAGRTLWVAA